MSKPDPVLKRTRVQISYTASDGFRYGFDTRGGQGSRLLNPAGVDVDPKAALLHAISELSRLCELFGCGDEAQQRVISFREAVQEWRKQRDLNQE